MTGDRSEWIATVIRAHPGVVSVEVERTPRGYFVRVEALDHRVTSAGFRDDVKRLTGDETVSYLWSTFRVERQRPVVKSWLAEEERVRLVRRPKREREILNRFDNESSRARYRETTRTRIVLYQLLACGHTVPGTVDASGILKMFRRCSECGEKATLLARQELRAEGVA